MLGPASARLQNRISPASLGGALFDIAATIISRCRRAKFTLLVAQHVHVVNFDAKPRFSMSRNARKTVALRFFGPFSCESDPRCGRLPGAARRA